jgi:ATP-dependent DNA ligase
MQLESIVSKAANAPYHSGRCEHWLKVKCWRGDRFVVVGFVPEGASGILKLRLARREGGALLYVGRVGTVGAVIVRAAIGVTRAAVWLEVNDTHVSTLPSKEPEPPIE